MIVSVDVVPSGSWTCAAGIWQSRLVAMGTTTTVIACENCRTKNRVPADRKGVAQCAKCHEPLPWIADADDATFTQVVDTASMPVLVDLWAPWCGPCRTVSPTLEQLARTYRGRVKLVKVNVDESPVLSRRFVVQGIPTLLLLSGGEVMARQTGAAPEAALRSWLDDALAQARGRADRPAQRIGRRRLERSRWHARLAVRELGSTRRQHRTHGQLDRAEPGDGDWSRLSAEPAVSDPTPFGSTHNG